MEREADRPRPPEPRRPPSEPARSDDFLFHLYRGSELLQDDRVRDAKEELEAALRLQPRDAKGQDLLAVVYFRLGLYPRAIEIYEALASTFPNDASLSNNLSLCYLKTGQPDRARVVLEQLVHRQPSYLRAWSYLGLAYERLGDLHKAKVAFERGQMLGMARRIEEQLAETARRDEPPREDDDGDRTELREAASEAFHELDRGRVSFSIAAPAGPPSGTWHALEPGQLPALLPPRRTASLAPPPSFGATTSVAPPPPAPAGVPSAAELTRGAELTVSREASISTTADGLVIARTDEPFSARLGAIRALVAGPSGSESEVLVRRARGGVLDQPLGGAVAPIASLRGAREILLGPRGGHKLVPFRLEDGFIYLREEALVGFDGRLAYENGRLAIGDGDAVSMVQLSGNGAVVLEVKDRLVSLPIDRDRVATVRRDTIIGWTGRLLPRPLAPSESLYAAGGMVAFSGEGAVLVSSQLRGLG